MRSLYEGEESLAWSLHSFPVGPGGRWRGAGPRLGGGWLVQPWGKMSIHQAFLGVWGQVLYLDTHLRMSVFVLPSPKPDPGLG